MLLVHKKLRQVKIGLFGKKNLKSTFFYFSTLKKPKTAFWRELENEVFSKQAPSDFFYKQKFYFPMEFQTGLYSLSIFIEITLMPTIKSLCTGTKV